MAMNDQLAIYKDRLKLQDADFSRIQHVDAMVADVFKISLQEQEFILKIADHSRNFFREIYFLEQLSNVLPVPKILQIVLPENNLQGAILMECLKGVLLTNLTKQLAFELGAILAKIHMQRTSGFGDPIGILYQEPKSFFHLKFEEGLAECKSNLPDELIEKCHSYYQAHSNLLLSSDGPCIIHRDFRPGNIIVNDGRVEGIIDWAGARFGFAEEDFASLEHGEWPKECKIQFLNGYASIRPIPDYERMMPLLRLSKAIAIMGFMFKRNTWDGSHSRLYQENRNFLNQFDFD